MRTLLMVVGADKLATAFPDSGKWVYTNITLPDQYIGNNTQWSIWPILWTFHQL